MFFLSGLFAKADKTFVDNVIGTERMVFGNVLNIIRIAGTGIALIMLAWMSIQYFTADGRGMPFSAERKADVKGRQLINFAIGAAIFIGASNIIYFIAVFVAQLFGVDL